MKVAIHQPEHFPYLGFFQKMKYADLFVILDNVQYKKNSWENRNWFIDENGNKSFFTVTVEPKAHDKKINEVIVAPEQMWKKKLLTKLMYHYKEDFSVIYEGEKLVEINLEALEFCREKLDIKTPMVLASGLNAGGSKSELLVNILKELNCSHYISGMGGKDYLDEGLFTHNEIMIEYFEPHIKNFHTILEYIYGFDVLAL